MESMHGRLLLVKHAQAARNAKLLPINALADAFSSNDDGSLFRIVFRMWLMGKSLLIWAGVPRGEGIAALA